MKKIKLSPQGTYSFQNLSNETWVTADYEYVEIFCFAMWEIKLELKEKTVGMNIAPSDERI